MGKKLSEITDELKPFRFGRYNTNNRERNNKERLVELLIALKNKYGITKLISILERLLIESE